MNIYLDIDGVLLTKEGKPANHLAEFLKYVTTNHDCYWLTTHCRNGGNRISVHLGNRVDPELLPYIEKIKPTNWDKYKTEAIDFSKDFRWFDDYIFEPEKNALQKHGSLNSCILVNLASFPEQLKTILVSLHSPKMA
jgi:hypothetical protein